MGNKREARRDALIIIMLLAALTVCGAVILEHNAEITGERIRREQWAKERSEAAKHLTAGLKGCEETMVREGDYYIESGAFCTDDRTGPVKGYEITGTVDTAKPGAYRIKYSFKSLDAEKTVTRRVHVIPREAFKEDRDGVSVLMYHYVYTESDMPEHLNVNYIKDSDLEEQLRYLRENGYYFPSFAELRAYVDKKISLPDKSVILSFDDGQYGFLNYGIPLLNKYEIPSVSFLIGVNEGESKVKAYASPYVSYESHSFNMHRGGGNIGHGGIISAMTKAEILEDLKKCADLTGNNEAFAYPFGDVTEDAEKAVEEAGILCAFTTKYGRVCPGDDFTELPRVRVLGDSSLGAYIAGL